LLVKSTMQSSIVEFGSGVTYRVETHLDPTDQRVMNAIHADFAKYIKNEQCVDRYPKVNPGGCPKKALDYHLMERAPEFIENHYTCKLIRTMAFSHKSEPITQINNAYFGIDCGEFVVVGSCVYKQYFRKVTEDEIK